MPLSIGARGLMSNSLETLPEAIAWLRQKWDGRPIPMRLHDRDTEGEGGLRFSGAFLAFLRARPFDAQTTEETDVCHHPQLTGDYIRACPDCWGIGTREYTRTRYRYPMWAALRCIENVPAIRPNHPSPYMCIALIVGSGWNARNAATVSGLSWDTAEGLFLMAIRRLHGRYRSGPVPQRSWLAKSENQQMAEVAVA